MEFNTIENKQTLKKWQIGAVVFSLVLGTLLHFVFNWSGENRIVAAFASTNESTWEHLKLLFFPMLIFGIFEYFFTKDITNNYIEAKTIGIVAGITSIIMLFYTYTGVIGTNFGIINIIIFVVGVVFGEYLSYKIMNQIEESDTTSKTLSLTIISILIIYFVLFTYITPKINIFKDPVNGEYGLLASNIDFEDKNPENIKI